MLLQKKPCLVKGPCTEHFIALTLKIFSVDMKNIRFILAEANQPERHSNMLAERTGAKVVQLAGSIGMLPNTDDYISLFDANVNALASAYAEK